MGQTVADSSSITIVKSLDDIEVVQQRSRSSVTQTAERMEVDVAQIQYMPKFLGTSDPVRYLESLAGVQTNSETTTGLHIHGCDDYQTLVSINGAPVFYPNHLFGLYSTFISPHFQSITLEQAEHRATMANRIGGWADFQTFSEQPARFGFEGNIGLINSDLTMGIPLSTHHAIRLSARTTYINWLYGRFLDIDGYKVRYHFMDYNLTYTGQLTDQDQLVISGFYSRDKMGLFLDNGDVDMHFPWQNIVGSAYWNRRLETGNWRTTVYYSSFDNQLNLLADSVHVNTDERFAVVGIKNSFAYEFPYGLALDVSLDYDHYFSRPLAFNLHGTSMFDTRSNQPATVHADEMSLGADLRHNVVVWFAYNAGVRLSGYVYNKHFYGAADPRVSLHFYPAADHEISIHYGIYHQYFHKSGLTGGGLPTDFFFLASQKFLPETAHAVNLKYVCSFHRKQYSISAEVYFKQIYNIAESTGNVLQVLNKHFSYDDYIVAGDGRNYGANIMFQRNSGIVTGYLSYSLGWARRKLPELEGYTDYRYAASSERRHDLKLVLNTHFAKRWHIGAMFVLATGLPYTKAEEVYFLNGKMVCQFGPYNGAHLQLYHRLDLSISCDIIKRKDHDLGINVSLYNTYANKNAQFAVYRDNLKPIYGYSLSTIIPSISIYGKF